MHYLLSCSVAELSLETDLHAFLSLPDFSAPKYLISYKREKIVCSGVLLCLILTHHLVEELQSLWRDGGDLPDRQRNALWHCSEDIENKSTETGQVMILKIWACRFSAQSAFDSQICEGYTVCRIYSVPGLQGDSRIPFCSSSSQCLPEYQEGHY